MFDVSCGLFPQKEKLFSVCFVESPDICFFDKWQPFGKDTIGLSQLSLMSAFPLRWSLFHWFWWSFFLTNRLVIFPGLETLMARGSLVTCNENEGLQQELQNVLRQETQVPRIVKGFSLDGGGLGTGSRMVVFFFFGCWCYKSIFILYIVSVSSLEYWNFKIFWEFCTWKSQKSGFPRQSSGGDRPSLSPTGT